MRRVFVACSFAIGIASAAHAVEFKGGSVHGFTCYKTFSGVFPNGHTFTFTDDECGRPTPQPGFVYTAVLTHIKMCGGHDNYLLAQDPFRRQITIHRPGDFCANHPHELGVTYMGVGR